MLEQMRINLFGVVNVTNAVLRYMRARREGTIFIVGSRSAWRNEWPVSQARLSRGLYHSFEPKPGMYRVLHSMQHLKRLFIVRNIRVEK